MRRATTMRLGWRKAITRRHPGYVRTKVFGEISIGWQNSCFTTKYNYIAKGVFIWVMQKETQQLLLS